MKLIKIKTSRLASAPIDINCVLGDRLASSDTSPTSSSRTKSETTLHHDDDILYRCSNCKVYLEKSYFYPSNIRRSMYVCKSCQRVRSLRCYKTRKEKQRVVLHLARKTLSSARGSCTPEQRKAAKKERSRQDYEALLSCLKRNLYSFKKHNPKVRFLVRITTEDVSDIIRHWDRKPAPTTLSTAAAAKDAETVNDVRYRLRELRLEVVPETLSEHNQQLIESLCLTAAVRTHINSNNNAHMHTLNNTQPLALDVQVDLIQADSVTVQPTAAATPVPLLHHIEDIDASFIARDVLPCKPATSITVNDPEFDSDTILIHPWNVVPIAKSDVVKHSICGILCDRSRFSRAAVATALESRGLLDLEAEPNTFVFNHDQRRDPRLCYNVAESVGLFESGLVMCIDPLTMNEFMLRLQKKFEINLLLPPGLDVRHLKLKEPTFWKSSSSNSESPVVTHTTAAQAVDDMNN